MQCFLIFPTNILPLLLRSVRAAWPKNSSLCCCIIHLSRPFLIFLYWKCGREKKKKKRGWEVYFGLLSARGHSEHSFAKHTALCEPSWAAPTVNSFFFFNNIIFLMLFTFIPSWTSPQLSSIEGRPTPAQTPPVSSNAQFTFPQAARCHI